MAKRILTPLTQTLLPALRTPVVCGPMANAAGGSLAANISKAGGLGFIGAGYYTPTKLQSELEEVYKVLGKPERGSGNRLEIGIGFLAWKLTSFNGGQGPPSLGSSDLDAESQALKLIDTALKAKPRAIWMSFGEKEELIGWSKIVREREAAINGGGKAKWGTHLKMFIGVGSREEAQVAVEDCSADVVVASGECRTSSQMMRATIELIALLLPHCAGIEAGGHGLSTSPPLSSLLPMIRNLLPSWPSSSPSGEQPLLLGAGGMHSGSSLVSTLALGADGAVFGTRFLLTPEASYSDEQKKMLMDASEGQTKRSMAFDEARGTMGWPKGVDGRGVINDTVKDFENDVGDSQSRRSKYQEAEKSGDTQRIVTWAGSGVGNLSKIMLAADVVDEIDREAVDELKRLQASLSDEQ